MFKTISTDSPGNVFKPNVLSLIIFSLAVGIFSVVGPRQLWWPFVIITGGIMLGISLVLFALPEDRKGLFTIFILALLLRAFLSVLLYDIWFLRDPVHPGFFIGDGYGYHYTGSWLVDMWQRGIFPDFNTIFQHVAGSGAMVSPTDYWCGFIYFFTGENPLVLFFINSVAGSITVIIVYFITKQLFNSKAAMIATLFSAFWPSLILWSTQNLKETITIFLLTTSFWTIVNLRARFRLRHLMLLILSVCLLFCWHETAAFMLFLAIFLSLLLSVDRRKVFMSILIVAALFFLLILSGVYHIILSKLKAWFISRYSLSFESINHLRYARTLQADSAFLVNMNIASLPRILVFLPFGLFFFFLSPFPWQVGNAIQILAIPEMLCWYVLLPFSFFGIFICVKERWKQSSVIILFILATSLLFALMEGNIGTLFRHRSIVLIFFLFFAAVGIARTQETKAKGISKNKTGISC